MPDGLPALYAELRVAIPEAFAALPRRKDTYYGALVLDYAGSSYDAACRAWAERAEVACTGLSPERAARCRAIFRACSEHELRFWEMCAAPRTDI